MMDEIQTFIDNNKAKITTLVGFDSQSETDVAYVETFMMAGIEDMQEAGVSDDVIVSKSLAVIALSQFIIDSMQETPGNYKTSQMYIQNVQKLKYMVIEDET
jgi:hypothetical protein